MSANTSLKSSHCNPVAKPNREGSRSLETSVRAHVGSRTAVADAFVLFFFLRVRHRVVDENHRIERQAIVRRPDSEGG